MLVSCYGNNNAVKCNQNVKDSLFKADKLSSCNVVKLTAKFILNI